MIKKMSLKWIQRLLPRVGFWPGLTWMRVDRWKDFFRCGMEENKIVPSPGNKFSVTKGL